MAIAVCCTRLQTKNKSLTSVQHNLTPSHAFLTPITISLSLWFPHQTQYVPYLCQLLWIFCLLEYWVLVLDIKHPLWCVKSQMYKYTAEVWLPC
jgi:hypothetical protein